MDDQGAEFYLYREKNIIFNIVGGEKGEKSDHSQAMITFKKRECYLRIHVLTRTFLFTNLGVV